MAPSAIHPLGSTTKGSRALLSPMVLFPPHRKVLCQVPACWRREGKKCAPADQLLAARLHVLLRRPRDTLSRSSTNISRRRLPGPRNGLVGYRSWSSNNISQLLSTSHQSGIAFVVRRPTSHNCVNFTHFRLPRKKGDSASLYPDMPSSGKRLQPTGPYPSHLCRTRVSVVFLFQHPESRPSRRARSARGWSFALTPVPERNRHPDVTHHQEGKQTTNNGALCEPTGQTQSVDF